MPTISHRGEVMPASPIRKLVPLANKAKEKGIKVFHLNIGQPDLPTPQIGLDALRHMHRRILEYSPSEGIKSLREKLVLHDLREPMAGLQRLRQRDQIFLFLAEHAVHRCSLLSQRKKLTAVLLRQYRSFHCAVLP